MSAECAALSQPLRDVAEGFSSEHSHHSVQETSKLSSYFQISDLKFPNGSLNLSLSFLSPWLASESLIFAEMSACLLFV